MSASHRHRPLARGLAVVVGAVVATLSPAGPAGASGLAHLAAATAADLYVAVVVDFGGAKGAPSNFATCVKVPPGSTDADALAAAVGGNNVGYAPSGLLCAIDGYPQNGVAMCNASSGGEYFFWSYWNGLSGSWSYADKGPASTLVTPGDMEGWRYQDPGPAGPSAPAPGTAADFSQICPAEYAQSPTPTTTSTTAPPATGHPPATTTSTAAAAAPAATSYGSHGSTTTAPASSPSAGSTSHPTTTAPPSSTGNNHHAASAPVQPPRAPSSAHALGAVPHPKPAGSNWLAPVVVAVLVIGLGALAALRWRRRPGAP